MQTAMSLHKRSKSLRYACPLWKPGHYDLARKGRPIVSLPPTAPQSASLDAGTGRSTITGPLQPTVVLILRVMSWNGQMLLALCCSKEFNGWLDACQIEGSVVRGPWVRVQCHSCPIGHACPGSLSGPMPFLRCLLACSSRPKGIPEEGRTPGCLSAQQQVRNAFDVMPPDGPAFLPCQTDVGRAVEDLRTPKATCTVRTSTLGRQRCTTW